MMHEGVSCGTALMTLLSTVGIKTSPHRTSTYNLVFPHRHTATLDQNGFLLDQILCLCNSRHAYFRFGHGHC